MAGARYVAWIQGVFYILTGLWSILHIGSFLAVTGPKTDLWLVRTIGVLVFVIGLTLLHASRDERAAAQAWFLGAGTALGFVLIDTIYVMNGTIREVYLLDAVVEAMFVVAWTVTHAFVKKKEGREAAPEAPPPAA